jgi:hypothetical protein
LAQETVKMCLARSLPCSIVSTSVDRDDPGDRFSVICYDVGPAVLHTAQESRERTIRIGC